MLIPFDSNVTFDVDFHNQLDFATFEYLWNHYEATNSTFVFPLTYYNRSTYSPFTNWTSSGQTFGDENIIIPVIFSIVIFLGCVGNVTVIAVILKTRRRNRNTTNVFMLNLATADLAFLLFCIPFHAVIYTLPSWPFGTFTCKSVHFLQYASMLASVCTLVAMAFERFTAISFMTHSDLSQRITIAVITCVLIWIVSIGIASPWLVYYTVKTYHYLYDPEPLQICADDWGSNRHYRPIYFLCLFIFGYAIPLLTIFILSVITIRKLWSTHLPDATNPRAALQNKRRATRFVIVLVVVFGICWLPYHVTWLWANFAHRTFLNTYTFYYTRVFSLVLSYANSMMNPYIYACFSTTFRRAIMKLRLPATFCQWRNNDSTTVENDNAIKKPPEDIQMNGLHRTHRLVVLSRSLSRVDEIPRALTNDFESLEFGEIRLMRVQSCPTEICLFADSNTSKNNRMCSSLSA